MQVEEFLDKLRVIARQTLAVFLQVEDSASLALHLVDIGVVDPGNLVACAGALGATSTVSITGLAGQLLLLLDVADLGLNTELIVTALLLPEIFQLISGSL